MNDLPILASLSQRLEDAGWITSWAPAQSESSSDEVLATRGTTTIDPIIVEISSLQAPPSMIPTNQVIQLLVRYWFGCSPALFSELVSVLGLLNGMVKAGSFGCNAENGMIYLVEYLHVEEPEVGLETAGHLTGLLHTEASRYLQVIHEVARGELPYAEAVRRIWQIEGSDPGLVRDTASGSPERQWNRQLHNGNGVVLLSRN